MKQPNSKLLFFGSFNPIHLGHINMVCFAQQYLHVPETLFILSPQNPFKQKEKLLSFDIRLLLLKKAKKNFPFIIPCGVEKNMTQPNYTYRTIEILKQQYPNTQFFLLIGTDNWEKFHLWKNHEDILKNTILVLYPRTTAVFNNPNINIYNLKTIFLKNAPLINISASMIRNRIINKQQYVELLPERVHREIQKLELYK